jgi:LmbE family N-acetylglucosaminyl deacetylase
MVDVSELGTVLGIWAHPDDETYLNAGIMTTAIANGQRVVCVTATRGEEGSWDEETYPTATMGKVRTAELERCMEVLGVTEHHWLDIYDGTCDQVPHEEGVARAEAFVRDVEPDTVFTFGPEGMTDHADHKAVHRWTTEAFARAAKPGARLYYPVVTPEWVEHYREPLQKFNVFAAPGTPPTVPRDRLDLDYALPQDVLERKLRAIECHVSQAEHMLNALGRDFFSEGHKAETFRLGATK